ncbi:hypothetical protein J1N35_042737 [Gossypium stocksii]|uniref:Uncharacterized protein n=1 Tax=Gossypium stocksii TaxID=47602 RepID=A0A9D3ZER6_9ROSI|nr:hypothetical protein J1N35_042737 [Gossypium stocksii]
MAWIKSKIQNTTPRLQENNTSIAKGNDLGGFCEDHGFFCATTSLSLDSSGGDVQNLAVNELFEVASNESKSSPLILFVKDIESLETKIGD